MSTEETRDELLDHEYDGITEYDNRPPGWIMNILWASIVFAVGYWFYYHTIGVGSLPIEDWQAQQARAAEIQLAKYAGKEATDESLLLLSQVPDRVAEGRRVFEQFCVPCHMPGGEGSVGPNLTDAYWLHGPRPTDLVKTVTYGVPEKGMISWLDQLGPDRIQKVVAYLLTIKNRNLPGKAPQGEFDPAAGGQAVVTSAAPSMPPSVQSSLPPAVAPVATSAK